MELFYCNTIENNICRLNEEESSHCIRVLRHKEGNIIKVIDGNSKLLTCKISLAHPKRTEAIILECEENWGSHNYFLEMAVCPTKNTDRYEWFVEKACELGVDSIVPVIGEHSERKKIKKERVERIAISAIKQSLKASVPQIHDCICVKDYILNHSANNFNNINHSNNNLHQKDNNLKLIAYCFENDENKRVSIVDILQAYLKNNPNKKSLLSDSNKPLDKISNINISILIGPEGDFSKEEAELAIKNGWQAVHLGPSRLRTETAALTAVESVYLSSLLFSNDGNLRVYTDLDNR